VTTFINDCRGIKKASLRETCILIQQAFLVFARINLFVVINLIP
jgi:hypothetical protein